MSDKYSFISNNNHRYGTINNTFYSLEERFQFLNSDLNKDSYKRLFGNSFGKQKDGLKSLASIKKEYDFK